MVRNTNTWTPVAECQLNKGEEYLIRELVGDKKSPVLSSYTSKWRGAEEGFHSQLKEKLSGVDVIHVEVYYNRRGL
jgi:hypothetical protein